jgi:hypothetical protein
VWVRREDKCLDKTLNLEYSVIRLLQADHEEDATIFTGGDDARVWFNSHIDGVQTA